MAIIILLRKTIQKKGYNALEEKDVQNGFVNKSELVTISESAYDSMKRAHLQENDILLSIVGTIGNVALIKNKKDHVACSCKLAIIRKSKINVDFLYAFLLSKYGQFQIKRMIRGALQQGLILPDLKKLQILKPPKKLENSVKKKILQMYENQQKSERVLAEINEIFAESLQTEDLLNMKDSTSIISSKRIRENKRMDAEYYNSRYPLLLKRINSYKNGYSQLCSSVILSDEKIDPKKYPNRKFNYVELADVDENQGIISTYGEYSGKSIPSRAQMILHKGDVIMSSVKGSFNKIAIVNKEQDGFLASTGFFVFRPQKISSEYLLALLKNPIIRLQFERETTGTILTAVSRSSVNKIIIPDLESEIQDKIKDLVKYLQNSYLDSKQCILLAIHKIESHIESSS